jgi:pimeloyl-ACP methyl ester carboxylesterase
VRAIAVLAALTAAAAGLRRVRAPIRCLNSDKWPTNVEGNRRYTERFDAVIIPGVGHFPMLEVSATFDRLLEEAVRDLVPAR